LETEAEKIAYEIENNQTYKDRIEVENGDEEAAFAAVTRPQAPSPQPSEKGNDFFANHDVDINIIIS
jgi:ataxin 2/2L